LSARAAGLPRATPVNCLTRRRPGAIVAGPVPAALSTSTKELGDSRVRVEVQVPSEAVERELMGAARALANDLKISGFRKGKVPPQVVLQRIGREAVLEEAVRRALPVWYEEAVSEARLATVGDPKLDLSELPGKGAPLAFSIEVAVRPTARLGEYKGLEVGRREAAVRQEDVDAALTRLRDSFASLETVEREAAEGDFLVIDFLGTVDGEPFEGGEARGYLLELGSGRLMDGFEDQLAGAKAGDEREIRVTFPDDHPAQHLAGREATFAVSVKEVKEKRLRELDDDFAAEAGGVDTLDELRADIESKLKDADERAIESEFREAVVDAAAERATVDLPHDLVHAKAHEMWEHTARRLQTQGISPQRYAQLAGKDQHELIDEAEPEAERALRRESVLAAVVEAEGIEVSDDDVLDALRQATAGSAPGGEPPSEKAIRKTLERAREQGRDELLREDIAMRKAVELLVESAKPIPASQAKAREELWTPEKETKEKSGQLWTPGS
jgi:trigger factor